MKQIDQHSEMVSWKKALNYQYIELEGRSVQDRLKFISDFSTLINYYDLNNQHKGDWSRFVLKDPIILLATIASTDYKQLSKLFKLTAQNTLTVLQSNKKSPSKKLVKEAGLGLNQMFDQLTDIYLNIELWTSYMYEFSHHHTLKKYLFKQLSKKFAPYLWSMLSLQDFLHVNAKKWHIKKVDYSYFDDFNKKTWKNTPLFSFWELFNIDSFPDVTDMDSKLVNQQNTLDGLNSLGTEVLDFLTSIVNEAKLEFEAQKKSSSIYPDTILIRAFCELLNVYKVEFNELNKRHLKFYYKSVLKQKKRQATADEVFVDVKLGNNVSSFTLPKGSLFLAGKDAQKQPILFESTSDASLNAAEIKGAYTLFKKKNQTSEQLILSNITAPTAIQKDQIGKDLTWTTFGNNTNSTVKPLGLAIASPLLLLTEGQRQIVIQFSFKNAIGPELCQSASVELSTAKSWFPVKKFHFTSPEEKEAKLTITLTQSDPAIESFSKATDGYSSSWPLVKLQFQKFDDLSAPPIIQQMTIDVAVLGYKSLELYNDYGKLSTKKPFEPFGPTVNLESNFFIGSTEIFSKPVYTLNLDLEWSSLPETLKFSDYYQSYNQFLAEHPINGTETDNTKKKDNNSGIGRFFKSLFTCKKKKCEDITPPKITEPFNNQCFTVNFQQLTDNDWNTLNGFHTTEAVNPSFPISVNPYTSKCEDFSVIIEDNQLSLYSVDDTCFLESTSNFTYENSEVPIPYDASLQKLETLKLSNATSNGFISITIAAPSLGFGQSIYPKVVTSTSLFNAYQVANKCDYFKEVPNTPYVPKVKGITANYQAKTTYDFSKTTQDLPIELFTYTPFKNFKVYANNSKQTTVNHANYTFFSQLTTSSPAGIPLYIPFNGEGALFMALNNLEGNEILNLNFQLGRRIGANYPKHNLTYSYLSDTGWGKSPLLSDSTRNYQCSGIVQMSIPTDVSKNTDFMPSTIFWIAIAVADAPSCFADTVCVNNNGVKLQRKSTSLSSGYNTPYIAANTVTGPYQSIPQIASVQQLFPSFGGRSKEKRQKFYQRVSNRLSSKDRVVKTEDYTRIISREFPEIFFSQTTYNRSIGVTQTFLIESKQNASVSNAFLPLVDDCTILNVQNILDNHTSALARQAVLNYTPQYVAVNASISLKTGVAWEGFVENLMQMLNIYLSPWVKSEQIQLNIEDPISNNDILRFISAQQGVEEVNNVSFSVYNNLPNELGNTPVLYNTNLINRQVPQLYVSAIIHNIQPIPEP